MSLVRGHKFGNNTIKKFKRQERKMTKRKPVRVVEDGSFRYTFICFFISSLMDQLRGINREFNTK